MNHRKPLINNPGRKAGLTQQIVRMKQQLDTLERQRSKMDRVDKNKRPKVSSAIPDRPHAKKQLKLVILADNIIFRDG